MNVIKNLYLTRFFFLLYGVLVALFIVGFIFPFVFSIAKAVALGFFIVTIIDFFSVIGMKKGMQIKRIFQEEGEHISMGDVSNISLEITNQYSIPLRYELYEGFPEILQDRTTVYTGYLIGGKTHNHSYKFRPTKRGTFDFGNCWVSLGSPFYLFKRKHEFALADTVHVYPSVRQMRQYELTVFNKSSQLMGLKKVRKLGINQEFEQIRNYIQGDDLRTINWKATGRRNELMVNQYQEERAQQVYCVVDKSRAMQQRFKGMTLLDYAINSSLVLSNIIIRKGDYAGLLTFSDKIGTYLKAERSKFQLKKIYESLYNQKTNFQEANFPLAYETFSRKVTTRSLMLFYTNFESVSGLERALPTLRKMNQKHLLVIVLFENMDLDALWQQAPLNTSDIYNSVVAEELVIIKKSMIATLRQHGIIGLLSKPEELSIKVINEYLSLKARGKA